VPGLLIDSGVTLGAIAFLLSTTENENREFSATRLCWSKGNGGTAMTPLCAAHHHRSVHEGIGRIRIRGRAPDGLRFELPLATYGPGERVLR